MGSNSVLTTLIQDAILKLCTQNVLFDASLEIDGIICISPGQESKEIVVKMHRTIMKPTPEPEVFQPEPSPKSTPHRRNRNQQAHSSNIESDTFPAQTSNISFDEMPKHDTYQDESGGATAYFPDEQQQYDTTPSKQSRKRRQPQTPTDTSSEEKYIKVEPGEGEILVEEPTNMPAAGESNDSYSDTSQGGFGKAQYYGTDQHVNLTPSAVYSLNPTMDKNTRTPTTSSAMNSSTLSAGFIKEDETKYECCGNKFPAKACFDYHKTVVHDKYCEVCSSRIDHEIDSSNHGKIHTGEKPFQCEFCYKLMGSKSGLRLHQTRDLICGICCKKICYSKKLQHLKLHQGQNLI